jgi:alpha-amylase/alpha-mannosidase (GH57 family)
VINFTPVLLEQIEDYCQQILSYLEGHGTIRDPILAELAEPALPGNQQARLKMIQDCLRANREHMIERFEPYQRLATMAEWYQSHPESLIYASNQFLADLVVWYHLSWMAESTRRSEPRIGQLQDKAGNFSLHERRELLRIILEQMQTIVPRYRELAASGKVELCMSPYGHPIVPLLLDINSAREAMPEVHLPISTEYPGGMARAQWHIDKGLATFQRVFGQRPRGIWPSEGGLSQANLQLFADNGFKWTASGGSVLHNSHDAHSKSCSHRVYRFGEAEIDCVFRDDGLSDLIGFTYSDWHSEDAVSNLIGHMENIADVCPDRDDCLISIILDGENAWEYYPQNGDYFLKHLYTALAEHPRLELTTFGHFLVDETHEPAAEEHLTAGSWVYGTFSTWIGDPDKNRAWELLIEAKHSFDEVVASGTLTHEELEAAELQLAVCEGSDWFWWFGDYNPSSTVEQFDQLFRMHLANLYHMLRIEAPPYLTDVISRGGGRPTRGGVMRHHNENGESQ